jgi:hypothetical protein
MRLVRNLTEDGKCKYALLRVDKLRAMRNLGPRPAVEDSIKILERAGLLEWAGKGDPEEAFVIKLKDCHAPLALTAYAESARNRPSAKDHELADDVIELAQRAITHPQRHKPDTQHITQ